MIPPSLTSNVFNVNYSADFVESSLFTANSGSTLVAVCFSGNTGGNHGEPISVVDELGNQFTKIASGSSGSAVSLSVWIAPVTVNGSDFVSATWSASLTVVFIEVLQYNNPLSLDTTVGSASNSSISHPFTTTNSNDVIIAIGNTDDGGGTFTAGDIGSSLAVIEGGVDAGFGAGACYVEDLITSSPQTNITASMNISSFFLKGILVVALQPTVPPPPLERASTTTFLAISNGLNPSIRGQSVTFSVNVSSSGGAPTGIVVLADNLNNFPPHILVLNASGNADSAPLVFLTVNDHFISAEYQGTPDFSISTGRFFLKVIEVVS